MQLENPQPQNSIQDDTITPLMAQYLSIKSQNPDCLLFFRLGDFYEMFFDDAVKASKALDIALTRRGQYQGQDVPMCGVPAHSHENYLARLIRQGFHVAICEQTEEPAEAKKRGYKSIVTREITRIITPGTVTEDGLLEARAPNYLACLTIVGDDLALAWLDLASGEPYTQTTSISDLSSSLARINPSEILLPQRLIERPDLFEILEQWKTQLTPQPSSRFDSDNAHSRLLHIYNVRELDAFGNFSRVEVAALGALLDYISLTQKNNLSHLSKPKNFGQANTAIDPATRRNLELTRTLSGEIKGSLLHSIDRTLTSAGARLLVSRLNSPLTDIAIINRRLDTVDFMLRQKNLRATLRDALNKTADLERALARITLGRGGPRDIATIRNSAKQAGIIKSALLSEAMDSVPAEIKQAIESLGEHSALIDRLERALTQDLPMQARDGGFIAKGYAPQLDDCIALRDDSKRLIAGLQQKYAEISGASALKIKHNNVIGYFIEVSPTHADKLLAQKELFIHRQSLASAIRFSTVELGELARKISEAADKSLAIEMQLFADLVNEIINRQSELRLTSSSLAEIDVASSLAELAFEQDYVRPIVDGSLAFKIEKGRHTVVEQSLKQSKTRAVFVQNDCDLSAKQRLWLITGPNMAGKSTYLRQNAIIIIMAQMGAFVPAKSAHIGVVDCIFSRVGAADDLARGRSTFMVEMVETASILNQASEKSLVILDEIGRGTSTYDGLSIAWATLEHLHEVNKCRALFATHYHELTSLAEKLSAMRCATMKIKEWHNEIIFLHEVAFGSADRSYGIHVAKMAGLPDAVINRASEILQHLEQNKLKNRVVSDDLPLFSSAQTLALPQKNEIESLLEQTIPDELTPKQALELLYKLKRMTSNG